MNILKIRFRTPIAVGKTGHFSVLDSILLQRLCLFTQGDTDKARALLPLERGDRLWMCGGGIDPQDRLFQKRMPSQSYKVYRRLMTQQTDVSPRELHKHVTRRMGQETFAEEWTYLRRPTQELHFRFLGDERRVLQLIEMEPFIGPGHSVGLGEIDHVWIETAAIEHPYGCFLDDRGLLTRPVPEDWEVPGQIGYSALEAPYWCPATPHYRARCPFPGGLY